MAGRGADIRVQMLTTGEVHSLSVGLHTPLGIFKRQLHSMTRIQVSTHSTGSSQAGGGRRRLVAMCREGWGHPLSGTPQRPSDAAPPRGSWPPAPRVYTRARLARSPARPGALCAR